jgi:hypothetical protein
MQLDKSYPVYAIISRPLLAGKIEVFGAYTDKVRAEKQVKSYRGIAANPNDFFIMPIAVHEGPGEAP